MQNVVMNAREEALAAICAPFELSVCTSCGLGFNSLFDPNLMQYDARYDNDVPSSAFSTYYHQQATLLRDKLGLEQGTVYDVGCGKGTFLQTLCSVAPHVRGIGIDPSCAPQDDGRVSLVQALFSPEHVVTPPTLLLCRHVLEHMDEPAAFVRMLLRGVAKYPQTPLYLEVPELGWIFRKGAFWDFCYEHCNYFSPSSLRVTAQLCGLTVRDAATSFEEQYQWLLCLPGAAPTTVSKPAGAVMLEQALRYGDWEQERIAAVRRQVEAAADRGGACVLWGMATKGVVFANVIDPRGELIAGGIDMNVKKQGCFVPGTGHAIHAPAWLSQQRGPVTLFIMNPNYRHEISDQVNALGIEADLVCP